MARYAIPFSGIAAYRREFFAGCTGGAFPLKPLLIRAMAGGPLFRRALSGLVGRCRHRGGWRR